VAFSYNLALLKARVNFLGAQLIAELKADLLNIYLKIRKFVSMEKI